MTQHEEKIRNLRLVVEKAEKLEALSFTKYMEGGGKVGFSGTRSDDGSMTFERTGPSSEAVDAFVLTLRFFVQNNEPISFANLETLFANLPIDQRRIDAVRDSRREINSFLDAMSYFRIGGKPLSRRELFEGVLWGGLAHSNKEKKKTYDSWMQDPALAAAIPTEFIAILQSLLRVIRWFKHACQEAIDILEQPTPTTSSP